MHACAQEPDVRAPQVILAYGLRSPLAKALMHAARSKSQDAVAPAWLLNVGRLLHMLDVMDDATAPPHTHTQVRRLVLL